MQALAAMRRLLRALFGVEGDVKVTNGCELQDGRQTSRNAFITQTHGKIVLFVNCERVPRLDSGTWA